MLGFGRLCKTPIRSNGGMAIAASSFPLKLLLLFPILIAITLFFILFPPHPSNTPSRRRLLLQSPTSHCTSIFSFGAVAAGDDAGGGGGLLNYTSLHLCLLSHTKTQDPAISLPLLAFLVLIHFYALVKAAADHFTPVVTALSSHLRLSPSMAAVTLLALGNGAPDLFASVTALRHGQPRTGLAAIISAGAFVSAFVVGSVAIISAPFVLDPAPFVRDVFFYLIAVSALFYIYLSAEIYLWQTVGFVALYVFFVGLVFWMDLGRGSAGRKTTKNEEEEEELEMGLAQSNKAGFIQGGGGILGDDKELVESRWSFFCVLGKVRRSLQTRRIGSVNS